MQVDELLPRSFEDFATEPNSPILRSALQQREAFRSFERMRTRKLALVQAAAAEGKGNMEEEERKLQEAGLELVRNAYNKTISVRQLTLTVTLLILIIVNRGNNKRQRGRIEQSSYSKPSLPRKTKLYAPPVASKSMVARTTLC